MHQEGRERFPHHRLHRKPLVSDPGMHHGTYVTPLSWCMSGSLTHGGRESVPGIPSTCATRNYTCLAWGPYHTDSHTATRLELCWKRNIKNPYVVLIETNNAGFHFCGQHIHWPWIFSNVWWSCWSSLCMKIFNVRNAESNWTVCKHNICIEQMAGQNWRAPASRLDCFHWKFVQWLVII